MHRSLSIKGKKFFFFFWKKKKAFYQFISSLLNIASCDERTSICMEHCTPTLTLAIVKTNYFFQTTSSISQSPGFYYLMRFSYMLVPWLQRTSDAYKESSHARLWDRASFQYLATDLKHIAQLDKSWNSIPSLPDKLT